MSSLAQLGPEQFYKLCEAHETKSIFKLDALRFLQLTLNA
jgi:hypothetical protein